MAVGQTVGFRRPSLEELNSPLLMWRMHKEVKIDRLPPERVVIQFEFYGAERSSYWLVLNPDDVTLCLTDPGFGINVMVTADLVAFFKMWAQHISYQDVIESGQIEVEGAPHLIRAFPEWFAWGDVEPAS